MHVISRQDGYGLVCSTESRNGDTETMAAERDGQFTVSGQQPSSGWSCGDANIRFSDVIISLLRDSLESSRLNHFAGPAFFLPSGTQHSIKRELAELCRT